MGSLFGNRLSLNKLNEEQEKYRQDKHAEGGERMPEREIAGYEETQEKGWDWGFLPPIGQALATTWEEQQERKSKPQPRPWSLFNQQPHWVQLQEFWNQ